MVTKKQDIDYKLVNKQLEDIISKLQLETTTIEESLELYQQATDLIKAMEDYLNKAENKIKLLNKQRK